MADTRVSRLLWAWMGVAVLLAGCSSMPSVAERTSAAERIAADAGLQPFAWAAAPLPLHGFARRICRDQPLHVYIEGDGLAWVTIDMPSPDPTPVNPVALRLAARDSGCSVLYLGRPGQYAGGGVDSRYWLGARFAPEVIDSVDVAIRDVATKDRSSAVRLTGYSGGGAVAALVAARLHAEGLPVELVTVAGNLDSVTWTRRRKLSPLTGSLNPADVAKSLATVPQVHLAGRGDTQVPEWVLDAFLSRMPSRACVRVVEVGTGHAGPWEAAWQAAMAEPPACNPSQHSPH